MTDALPILHLDEDFVAGRSRVHLDVVADGQPDQSEQAIEGEGVGVIDALVHGLRERLSVEYKSLDTIEFVAKYAGDFGEAHGIEGRSGDRLSTAATRARGRLNTAKAWPAPRATSLARRTSVA